MIQIRRLKISENLKGKLTRQCLVLVLPNTGHHQAGVQEEEEGEQRKYLGEGIISRKIISGLS